MGARFEALIEGVLIAPLDYRYTEVGFNFISAQVCDDSNLGLFLTTSLENDWAQKLRSIEFLSQNP